MTVPPRLADHDPQAGHDTGGVPWGGREVHASPFADDTGEPDPDVLAATDLRSLAAALAGARLFVPVVAVPTEVTHGVQGLAADARSDMATLTLTAPDGERALPAFTSVDALCAWDAAARPVPVRAVDAARAAIDEECSVLVLDVGGDERVVPSSVLWALAQRRDWTPASQDPVVLAAVNRAATAAVVEPRDDGRLHLVLPLAPGLPQEGVDAATAAVAHELGAAQVRVRLDDVSLRLQRTTVR